MFVNYDVLMRGHSERSSERAKAGRNAVEESRGMPCGHSFRGDGILRLRVVATFAHGDTPLAMNPLPNRGHPERSEGSLATGTESKDPVSFTIDVHR